MLVRPYYLVVRKKVKVSIRAWIDMCTYVLYTIIYICIKMVMGSMQNTETLKVGIFRGFSGSSEGF